MGRRSDPPAVQAAKGFPGKRLSKAQRQLAEAEALADSIAAAPTEGGEPMSPPVFLEGGVAGLLAVSLWREYAPRLAQIHLLEPTFRHTFATFCVYAAEFVLAQKDIAAKGHYSLVKTVSGDRMPRLNPMLRVRDEAAGKVLELSKRFGLTPIDQIAIFKDHAAAAAAHGGGLFAAQRTAVAETGAPQNAAGAEGPDPVALMSGFDSTPPARPN
jgi:phage terminase small subunit